MITLILGGEKSGKSALALSLAGTSPGPRYFVATGRPRDPAFAAQIARHKSERSREYAVIETVTGLPEVLTGLKPRAGTVIADSLEFWLFSLIQEGTLEKGVAGLADVLSGWAGPELILVGAEAGLGVVAADPFTRRFVRELGGLNQRLAAIAQRVILAVAGLPLTLKG